MKIINIFILMFSVTIAFSQIDTLNDSLLLNILDRLKIKESKIVLAQAKLETGNYKSNYYVKKHNLFGFRDKKGYIEYTSILSSCIAYKKFQKKYYKGGDYYDFLTKIGYAEDSTYNNKLKNIVKCLK